MDEETMLRSAGEHVKRTLELEGESKKENNNSSKVY
jgi:hypothetical protein